MFLLSVSLDIQRTGSDYHSFQSRYSPPRTESQRFGRSSDGIHVLDQSPKGDRWKEMWKIKGLRDTG